MTVTIWHNPRCTKSRQTLALLEENGVTPKVRLYLEDGPSKSELEAVLKALDVSASALVRRGEAEYRDAGLTKESDDKTLIAAMVQFPKLIERPIVITPKGAAIGRPPEAVLALL